MRVKRLSAPIILFLGVFLNISGFSQDRLLKKGKGEINSGNFAEAIKTFQKYEANTGKTAGLSFMLYNYFSSKASTVAELDSAYTHLHRSIQNSPSIPEDKRKDWCDDLGYCVEQLVALSADLDAKIYYKCLQEDVVGNLSSLLKKYPRSTYINQATFSRDSAVFQQVIREGGVQNYRDFLASYPTSSFVVKATDSLHVIAYRLVETERDIEKLKDYIEEFPTSIWSKVAQDSVYSIAFSQAQASHTLAGYTAFIQNYGQSPQAKTAQALVYELAWEHASKANTREAYVAFKQTYATSDFVQQANKKIEEFDWAKAKQNDDITHYTDFSRNYPRSTFFSEAQARIEELRKLVLPYLLKNGNYRLFDVTNNTFISNQEYQQAIVVNKETFIVQQGQKMSLINSKGEKKNSLLFDCFSSYTGSKDSLLIFTLGERQGLLNTRGDILVQPQYQFLQFTETNSLIASRKDQAGKVKYGLLNLDGKVIKDFIFDDLYSIANSKKRIIGRMAGLDYLLNAKGEKKSGGFEGIEELIADEVFTVTSKGKKGLIDSLGKLILPITYNSLQGIDGKYIITSELNNTKEGIVTKNGTVILPAQLTQIYYLREDLFKIGKKINPKLSPKYFVFNAESKKYLSNVGYDEINGYSEGLAAVLLNDKVGFINLEGTLTIPTRFHANSMSMSNYESIVPHDSGAGDYENIDCILYQIDPTEKLLYYETFENYSGFKEGLKQVDLGDKGVGFINKSGEMVIPGGVYSSALGMTDGHAIAISEKSNGEDYYLITKEGKSVVRADAIEPISKSLYACTGEDGEVFIYDVRDAKIKFFNRPFDTNGYVKINYFDRFFTLNIFEKKMIYTTEDLKILAD